jgi:hypothetical protein
MARVKKIDRLRWEFIGLKEKQLELFLERRRIVRQMDLVAPVPSALVGQRRWNTSPPHLPLQPASTALG